MEFFEALCGAARGALPTALLHSLSNDWGTDEAPMRSADELLELLRSLPSEDAFVEVVFCPGVRFTFRRGDALATGSADDVDEY